MENKKINLENVIEFINTCEKEDFKQIKYCDRINKHINLVRDELQDEIEDLQDKIDDLEYECKPSYESTIDFIQSATNLELNEIKQEIADYLNETTFVPNNLYDDDKMQILSTAFNKYTLDELMEKLEITWLNVI